MQSRASLTPMEKRRLARERAGRATPVASSSGRFAAAARRAVVSDDESLRDVVRAVEAELSALDTVVA